MPGIKGLFKKLKPGNNGGNVGAAGGAIAATTPAPATPVAPTVAQNHAGMPTEKHFLRDMVGNKKSPKNKKLAAVVKHLKEYHKKMDKAISISGSDYAIANRLDLVVAEPLKKLMDDIYECLNIGPKDEKAKKEYDLYRPALTALMVQALQVLPRVANLGDYLTEYLLEVGNMELEEIVPAEMIDSKSSMRYTGFLSDGGIDLHKSNIADYSAYESTVKIETNGDEKTLSSESLTQKNIDAMRGIDDRIDRLDAMLMPALEFGNPEKLIADLNKVINAIDAIDLQAVQEVEVTALSNNSDRNRVRVHYTEIMKLMAGVISELEMQDSQELVPHIPKYKMLIFQIVEEEHNDTVGAVVEALDKRMENSAYKVEESEEKHGALNSVVYLGESAHRASNSDSNKVTEGTSKEKLVSLGSFTGSYDEALSKLAEAIGCGDVVSSAETRKFKDKEGKMQYGSKMERATGKVAKDYFSTGDLFGNGKIGEHSLFDSSDKKSVDMNNKMMKLSLVDYISFHTDRHAENFLIDEETMELKAIDNDMAFGAISTMKGTERRFKADGMDIDDKLTKETSIKAFRVISSEIKKLIDDISPEKVEKAIKPYVNYRQRKMVLIRIERLKKFVSSQSKIFDITTADGMSAFKREQIGYYIGDISELFDGKYDDAFLNTLTNNHTETQRAAYLFGLGGLIKGKYGNGETAEARLVKDFDSLNATEEEKRRWFSSGKSADEFVGNFRSGKYKLKMM